MNHENLQHGLVMSDFSDHFSIFVNSLLMKTIEKELNFFHSIDAERQLPIFTIDAFG